ncbi:MAG: pyridoxal phosphate-dependent aminotransferase [Planctomycetes bacterium]|nr:pyridoxal phosphate-dependent aminotransferase [Planctomycetota bacterium]
MAAQPKLARRITQVQPSATLAVSAKAKAMAAEGIDVVGFGAGEPDFRTPEFIVEAGTKAMTGGDTQYNAKRAGELTKAIVAKLQRENGLAYQPAQVLVSNGAKHSCYNICQVVIDEGDEAIIPAPYWVSYLEMVRLAGGTPVVIETSEETGFKITPAQLEKAITPKTKLFFFNSPSNPTGAMYTPEEVRAIAAVVEKHNLITLSDEIYEHLVYGEAKHLSLASCSKKLLEELVITVNGVSKTFAMTGWRIGYVAGPLPLVKAMAKLQDHATSAPASFSQAGAAEALGNQQASVPAVEAMRKEFDARRKHMVERLNKLKGVTCLAPQGAFYCFPNVSGVFGRTLGGKTIQSAMDFTDVALEAAKVAVVPGEAFGSPKHVRLSYASSMASIDKGLDRLEKLLNG